ncbi:prepilin peptidase [Peptostreptococcus faecalis]|uniref:prepilin peptidase n=1 Tax=Peptostreptococcus faecalis TaxID=2045015 RepID=UPI000C7ADAF3|nr:prepilin peptidase [Peptostreptococcus faecalis]
MGSLIYFGITSIFITIYVIGILKNRGIFYCYTEKIVLFFIVCAMIQYNEIFQYSFLNRLMIIYFIPSMLIVVIVDIKERFIFDIDIISGIMIQVGIILIQCTVFVCSGIECWSIIVNFSAGMLYLFVISILIFILTKSMGAGDVLYFALIGLVNGLHGVLIIILISFLSSALYCVVMIIRKGNKDGLISFTPFISIGFIALNEIIMLV